MSVIAEFSIPASEFILGKALAVSSHLAVELDKVHPTGGKAVPYFWVVGEGRAQFDTVLKREPELTSFEVVDELDGKALYRVEWDASVDTFIQTVFSHDVTLQEMRGDGESWMFQARFPDSHVLSEFHTACIEAGVDLTVERLYNPIDPSLGGQGMTEPQRELLEKAYQRGFFDVPRQITLSELADEEGISSPAVSERMRRAIQALIESTRTTMHSGEER